MNITTTSLNVPAILLPVFCCECGSVAGKTSCEITATSPTMCDTCHADYIEEIKS
jgi:hypothetical protein